ncbi:YggS family pyridoxal phosphate-dependent enzyme [Gammaproteobacteria bacterium AS21]
MSSIANNSALTNLEAVKQTIELSCKTAHRATQSVLLLAVSKTRQAAQLEQLYNAGQRHFGENYLQEALDKQQLLTHLPIIWHFIGPIQSNKAKAIAQNFSWVHSVDRLKVARKLSEQRDAQLPALNICIQVNISNETNKAGCLAQECLELITQISALDNIKVRGLMAIPKATTDVAEQEAAFADLLQLFNSCKAQYPHLDTLSMGMSGDIEPAIKQGSTIVRVGTALFGPRDYSKK